MKRSMLVSLMLLLAVSAVTSLAGAAQVTIFVEPFSITGSKDPQMPTVLQALLGSRLSSQTSQVLDTQKGAQVVVKGTYIQFGKVFSVDVTARDQSGGIVARAFEQGEGQDELLPALTRLGEKLSKLLVAFSLPSAPAGASSPAPAPSSTVQAPSDIIKAEPENKINIGVINRLPGVYIGIAELGALEAGGRLLLLLQDDRMHVVSYGGKVQQLDEARFGNNEKALSVDTADLDADGKPEIYVTIMRDNELMSQVWIFKNNRLARIAEKLPYFFRALTGTDGKRKLYAQHVGMSEDFYGPVYEIQKGAKGYELQKPLKLPRFAHIFNFNQFADHEGNRRFVVLHPDGFLIVYAESGEELWRSNDKFGGSETYFSRSDQQNIQITGAASRKVFLEQRITVTRSGGVIVPHNIGTWVIGSSRNYAKNSVYNFAWNGVALEERWHTKEGQSYLSDYYFDESRKELVLLEVVKKEGIMEKGASAVSIKKVN